MADETAIGTGEAVRRERRAAVPSPAVLAVRLENLQRGHRAWRQKQGAAKRALAELYRELPVEELWRTVKPKLASAVALYLAGYEYPAIAAAIGYSGRPSSSTTVMKLLQRPEAKRLVEEIRQKQLERIIAGDYGVTATLRAAAPRIAAGVAALAGGIAGPDGRPEGKGPQAADVIKAADLAFTIGGYKVQRREVTFNVLLDGLSDFELQQLAEDGVWPERLKAMGMGLHQDAVPPGSSACPAPSLPALEPPPAPTERRPIRRGEGR